MSLEVSPEIETRIREYAEAEGISVNDLIARMFPPLPPQTPAKLQVVPDDDPLLQFLNARLREAENATPEEQAEAEAEWRMFAHNMNENRRVNGEQPLYPEVPPK